MNNKYLRKQVILEKRQIDLLETIAKKEGVSLSELVRNFLNSQLKYHIINEMEFAADALIMDYKIDKDLTDMTQIDGDEIIEG